MFLCGLCGPEDYTEMRYQQKVGMDNASKVAQEVLEEFEAKLEGSLK